MDDFDPHSEFDDISVDQLIAYRDAQGEIATMLRHRQMPRHPWPELDNPMVAYLIRRGVEYAESVDDIELAVAWIVAHAWYEATIEERARTVRSLTT